MGMGPSNPYADKQIYHKDPRTCSPVPTLSNICEGPVKIVHPCTVHAIIPRYHSEFPGPILASASYVVRIKGRPRSRGCTSGPHLQPMGNLLPLWADYTRAELVETTYKNTRCANSILSMGIHPSIYLTFPDFPICGLEASPMLATSPS